MDFQITKNAKNMVLGLPKKKKQQKTPKTKNEKSTTKNPVKDIRLLNLLEINKQKADIKRKKKILCVI